MGFRFRKIAGILPGIRLNISKRGPASLSIGRKGATVNLGRDGVKSTIGLPGSGASYSEYTSYKDTLADKPGARGRLLIWIGIVAALLIIGMVFDG